MNQSNKNNPYLVGVPNDEFLLYVIIFIVIPLSLFFYLFFRRSFTFDKGLLVYYLVIILFLGFGVYKMIYFMNANAIKKKALNGTIDKGIILDCKVSELLGRRFKLKVAYKTSDGTSKVFMESVKSSEVSNVKRGENIDILVNQDVACCLKKSN